MSLSIRKISFGRQKKLQIERQLGFPLFKWVTLGTCFTLVCQWELRDNLLWWYAIQVLEVIRWHLILFIGAPAIGKCLFWPLKCSKFWREFWQPFYGLIFKAEGCALKKWKAMKSNFCVLTDCRKLQKSVTVAVLLPSSIPTLWKRC